MLFEEFVLTFALFANNMISFLFVSRPADVIYIVLVTQVLSNSSTEALVMAIFSNRRELLVEG
jgi:hypothetical protein